MSTARRKIVDMLTKLQQFLKALVSLHLRDAKLETVITSVQDKYTEHSILYIQNKVYVSKMSKIKCCLLQQMETMKVRKLNIMQV